MPTDVWMPLAIATGAFRVCSLSSIERDGKQVAKIAVDQMAARHELRLTDRGHRLPFPLVRGRQHLEMRIVSALRSP